VSQQGVDALKAEREEVLAVARSLTADEWAQPSDCEGWRVQDVVTHMAAVFRQVADPSSLPPGVPGDTEATQDSFVAARKDWSPAEVLADYEDVSVRGIEALVALQAPGMAETVVPIEDLGSHPLHLLANALAFDHYCHLRNDILRPNGPVERPAPPDDDLRLGATMEWLISGLPQMAPDAMRAAVDRPLALQLDGPGGGGWTIRPAAGDGLVEVTEGAASDAAATATSTAKEFVVWATGRRPWRERDVAITGDGEYAARVLDAIRVF
jgi:uncharacterized protein (TIGR03083 family)